MTVSAATAPAAACSASSTYPAATITTGLGSITIGIGALPVGMVVNVPARTTVGTYTSTVSLTVISAP